MVEGDLRRRKTNQKQSQKKNDTKGNTIVRVHNNNNNNNINNNNNGNGNNDSFIQVSEQDKEPTLWETFKSHPLIVVLPIVSIPYLIYLLYHIILLQYPEVVTHVLGIPLRPSVNVTQERQLLIVGTLSSGTAQVAADLQSHLHLEIGHEMADTAWNFVRDGTVSWFHGIRFLSPPLDRRVKFNSIIQLCGNITKYMGYHPRMYQTSKECSVRTKGGSCWRKACLVMIHSEWGCHASQSCETPFRTTLQQVRHPLRTIESLVARFCSGSIAGTVHPSFLLVVSALFPEHITWKNDSCIEAAAHYVILYHRGMQQAQAQGFVTQTYPVETTTPCQIAVLAGLLDDPVYPPNGIHIQQQCQDPFHPANQIMISTKHTIQKGLGLVHLDWSDLQGGLHGSVRASHDDSLFQELISLTKDLGYVTINS